MAPSLTSQQIGDLLFESGLPQVFGIYPDDNLLKDPDHKVLLLFGFLKEAVDGNLADPNNIHRWEKAGQSLLRL